MSLSEIKIPRIVGVDLFYGVGGGGSGKEFALGVGRDGELASVGLRTG